MSWGFEVDRVYNRRNDIHARFGGQQQGGIITPSKHSLVIIITGEEGLEHGFADRTRDDGVFEYFGEGQVGDMQMQKGNRAIAEHSVGGKSLLLFRKAPEGIRFVGEMLYEARHIERAPDRTGAERDAIVFELRPLSAIVETVDAEPPAIGVSLADLRKLAIAAAEAPPLSQSPSVRN
ncbi:MAG: HNH endonuclease, partial [Pseudorhodoplanes sp.]|nr:HNH endonuclease [Pseudorhodoplanes sp.]